MCGEEKLPDIDSILDKIVPINDRDLISDPAGVFWIGVNFSQQSSSVLKVYINGKLGNDIKIWNRLDSFASYFDSSELWLAAKSLLIGSTKPLGMAISSQKGSPLGGRIYVSSYGNSLSYYENLIGSLNNEGKHIFQQFVDTFLGESRKYPLKSVVCSLGFGSHLETNFKFEICGHCVFKSDKEAMERSLNWARRMNLTPDAYLKVLGIVSGWNISQTKNNHHTFLGFGVDGTSLHSSLYLKPSLSS